VRRKTNLSVLKWHFSNTLKKQKITKLQYFIDFFHFFRYKNHMQFPSPKHPKPIRLSLLDNQKLHEQTITATTQEKNATLALLEHLAEIDRRRLYAIMGYSSLWKYVHHELGYSESQTSERVSAMRLMVQLPEVRDEFENNSVTLTTAAKLATHVRRERTSVGHALELLSSIKGKPSREVDRILATESSEPIRKELIKPLSAETTRILIDVDQEFLELLQRVRELKGNHGSSTSELIQAAMKEMVKRAEVKKTSAPLRAREVATEFRNQPSQIGSESGIAKNSELKSSTQSRHIPAGTRYAIRIRSGDQCEYIDPTTGRRCDCRTQLEFDHIIPFALGGDHSPENLRHFCRAHNQLAAIQFFGMDHMRAFLKN
jgi:hypothetical protein